MTAHTPTSADSEKSILQTRPSSTDAQTRSDDRGLTSWNRGLRTAHSPDTDTDDGQTTVPFDIDTTMEAIGCQRRRLVIQLAADHGEITVSDLSETIAARETGKEISRLTAQERKRVYTALIQHHLDILHDCSAIHYDDRSKHISATDTTTALATLIQHLTRVSNP